MSACYIICNFSKREMINTTVAGASKASEFSHTPAAAVVAIWYMLRNRGDNIAFVSEWDVQAGRAFFGEAASNDLYKWPDKTEETIAAAVIAGVIVEHGFLYRDEKEPDRLYVKDLRLPPIEHPLGPDGFH